MVNINTHNLQYYNNPAPVVLLLLAYVAAKTTAPAFHILFQHGKLKQRKYTTNLVFSFFSFSTTLQTNGALRGYLPSVNPDIKNSTKINAANFFLSKQSIT